MGRAMNQYESFSFLFTDSLCSNLVVSPHKELAIHVMKIMGGYDTHTTLVIGALGALCAVLINYVFGIVLYNLYRASSDQDIQQRYQKLTVFFNKYGIILLLISAVPHVGKFMILVAGFTRFGIIRSTIFATLGKVAYYIYVLYL